MVLFLTEMCRILGIVLLWSGILTLFYYIPLALCMIAASLFLLPNTFYMIFGRSSALKEIFRALAVLSLLVFPLYGWYRSAVGDPLVDTSALARQDVLEHQRKAALKRYQENREFILRGIRRYLDEGNYRFAYAHADEFMFTGDPELVRMHDLAREKMIEKGEFREP